MKLHRILAATCALTLALSLAACGSAASSSAPSVAPPATSSSTAPAVKDYSAIIVGARVDDDNTSYPVVVGNAEGESLGHNPSSTTDEDAKSMIDMMRDTTGFTPELFSNYAYSMSLINIRAYCVAILMPVKGQEAAAMEAVNAFVTLQQKAFENYLVDQYEVAKGTIIKELPSGEIIVIMSEGANDVADKIESALK